jgi:molybdate transport system ATP-binding protein
MTLRADVGIALGTLDLRVALDVDDGEVVAVVGPNGAGKTTLLRAVAGLLPIDEGRIEIGGRVVDDPAADVFVPTEQRSVGVVFQEHRLFANLSALENVAFGLRARGVPRAEARATAAAWLDRLGLADHAANRPGQLSGGQSQRVALGRVLAVDPALVLLDEPLAALDAATRTEVRRDLRRHLAGTGRPAVLVTHDPVDAHALADRVVVVEGGRVVQEGTLAAVTARPRSAYVAELVGTNLVAGDVRGGHLTTATGAVLVVPGDTPDGPSLASIRPSAIALHRHRPEGSARNSWEATVLDVDRLGDRVRVRLAGPVDLVAELTAAGLAALGAGPDDRLWASLKASEVAVEPDEPASSPAPASGP